MIARRPDADGKTTPSVLSSLPGRTFLLGDCVPTAASAFADLPWAKGFCPCRGDFGGRTVLGAAVFGGDGAEWGRIL